MTFTVTESKVKTVRTGDPSFMLVDGSIMYPRAMVHILPECPTHIRDNINWAISQGYLKPVAHIYDYEETFSALNTK